MTTDTSEKGLETLIMQHMTGTDGLAVVPNRVADGRALPRIEVLLEGMKVSRFGLNGGYLDEAFTNNPAWVLLDVLRRSGWPVTPACPSRWRSRHRWSSRMPPWPASS